MHVDNVRDSAEAAARAYEAQKYREAEIHALRALSGDSDDPLAAEVMGLIRIDQERYDEAIGYLKAGLRSAPDSARIRNLIGSAYAIKGRHKTAIGFFQQAAQAAPDHALSWENLGKAAYKVRQWSHARAAFEHCCDVDPANVEALAGLARLELRDKNYARAKDLATKALEHDPDHLLSRQVMAEVGLRLGELEQALTDARAITEHPATTDKTNVLAYGIAAEAAEKLDRFDEAFDLYTQMNRAIAKGYQRGATRAREAAKHEKLAEMARIVPEVHARCAAWPKEYDTPAGVFFLGFPNSGMSALAGPLLRHPNLISGEGREDTDEWRGLLTGDDAPHRVITQSPEHARFCRAEFWENVAAAGIEIPDGSRLFEYKPFYTQHMLSFAMIFPDAKYIFMHRDPRDVVLSCFLRRTGRTVSMYQFLDLEQAAHYYDLVMGVAWETRKTFDLDITDIGYDDIVADPEGEVHRIVEFLELPWDGSILGDRPPRAKPEGAAGQKWRRYEKHLAPVRKTLDLWAERFGYE